MPLDLTTLLIVSQLVICLCGSFFLIEYLRQRSVPNRWFAIAFMLAPTAPLFYFTAEAATGYLWVYQIGNGVATVAVALTWMGARSFHHRSTPFWIALAGPCAMVISVLALSRQFDAWSGVIPFMLTFSLFNFLSAAEFWRGSPGEPRLRNGIILTVTCGLNGLFYLSRTAAYLWLGPSNQYFLFGFGPESSTLILMLLVIAATFCLVALGKERAELAIYHAATHDGLTDILNRREFALRAGELLKRLSERNAPAAVLLLDLDHFKKINDRFGHATGDEVLVHFARIASESIRPTDMFCRYGGEEFAAFLPDTDSQDAWEIAERVRMNFCMSRDPALTSIRPTVSIGLAVSASSPDLTSLIANADKALYLAKSAGRNRTVRAEAVRAENLGPLQKAAFRAVG
jgi:diguanylate cyclase (GGDEF)-like protein